MNNQTRAELFSETPGLEEDILLNAAAPVNTASLLRPVSGLYQRSSSSVLPSAQMEDQDLTVLPTMGLLEAGMREELRLDVDGNSPQRVASGTIYRALNSQVHWVAKLAPEGQNTWTGTVWYKNGDLGAFPYTNVKILVIRSGSLAPQGARIIYSGGGAPNAERAFAYMSPYFHSVEFEFDYVEGVAPTFQINTAAHPNRPANLPAETLTIPRVFQRAGYDVQVSSSSAPIPIAGSGANAKWSDMEMHDAMQRYWSRFSSKSQWAMWVFYAPLHERGESLGGIMFDDIGGNHRQGTAIFTNSFIAQAPADEAHKKAWVERMGFWCACHEMGHAFNLAHSWQKALGTPWIPLANEPEARSFMNYPYNVSGGQTAFFANFHYRFSNDELIFMRHAPERFVQMGNADWFDHHAFEQASILPKPTYRLELRAGKANVRGVSPAPLFEFLEPVVLEMKLTNISGHPQVVPLKFLSPSHHLTVIVKRQGQPAKEVVPFATYCWQPQYKALNHGESMFESLFVSVGQGGWGIAEPGYYTVQVALHRETEDIVSNPLTIRVAPPLNYQEEFLAQDFFSESVGRILTFDGSRVLTSGNDTIEEVTAQLPDRKVAIHCQVAQANAFLREYKELPIRSQGAEAGLPANAAEETDRRAKSMVNGGTAAAAGGKIKQSGPDLEKAGELLGKALARPEVAAESLGNIDLNYYLTRLSNAYGTAGANQEAIAVLDTLARTLETRNASTQVLGEVQQQRDALSSSAENGKGSPKAAKGTRKNT